MLHHTFNFFPHFILHLRSFFSFTPIHLGRLLSIIRYYFTHCNINARTTIQERYSEDVLINCKPFAHGLDSSSEQTEVLLPGKSSPEKKSHLALRSRWLAHMVQVNNRKALRTRGGE